MYFFKHKGKQILDCRGVLILSHNQDPVRTRTRNNGPRGVRNMNYVVDIPNLKFFRKIRATWVATRFIWGASEAMETTTIDKENGLRTNTLCAVCGKHPAERDGVCVDCSH